MSDLIYLDIETSECIDTDILADIKAGINPPGNIKLAASKEKWLKEKGEQAYLNAVSKTSFDGFAGSINCIGFAINDEPVQSVYREFGGSERELLQVFWDALIATKGQHFNPTFVAHNITFDLPFLFKRCVVNNVRPPIHFPHNQRPWGRDVFCTLHESVGLSEVGGSLNRIAKILGLGQKTEGINGADINQYWLDGREKEISDYCKQDVELCRKIYKRLNFIGE